MAYHHQPDAAEPAFQPLCRLIWAANALSTIALDHGRTKIWQASVEARSEAYGNAELAQINEEDGINALDLSDILEYLGGRADVHLLRKVIRTLLLRVEMAVAISVVPSRG